MMNAIVDITPFLEEKMGFVLDYPRKALVKRIELLPINYNDEWTLVVVFHPTANKGQFFLTSETMANPKGSLLTIDSFDASTADQVEFHILSKLEMLKRALGLRRPEYDVKAKAK